MKNIKSAHEEKEYLNNGLKILARIIVREELKKQSQGTERTDTYSTEKKLLHRRGIYYRNKIRKEKKD